MWGPPEKSAPSPIFSCLSKRRTHPLPHCPPAAPQKDQKSTRNVNPFSCRHLWTASPWWIGYREQVNVWPGQHTAKPCARPSLPPYLLYKVSKSCYYTFFSFHCHFASPLHSARKEMLESKCYKGSITTELWLWSLRSHGRSNLVFFSCFFLERGGGEGCCWSPPMAFLLFASSVLCFALLQCMNPSLKWVTEKSYPSSCHRQLGAVVSSIVALGFRQELKCWDFSPCCTLSLHESSALQWSATLPTKHITLAALFLTPAHASHWSHRFWVVQLTFY